MRRITLEEAQTHLAELIGSLAADEMVVITEEDRPVAQLIGVRPDPPRPVLGRCQGMLTILSEGDEHLQDWAEYLP